MENEKAISTYLAQNAVQQSIANVLGNRAAQFTASMASLVNSSPMLQNADKKTILMACLTAASLDLPINQSLGFAYIIPYKGLAQFQMGYKGFIQLAQRSGQFKTINVSDVREGEIARKDRLTGEIEFNWIENNRESKKVIGYVAYMRLNNGFEKSLYMTVEEIKKHGNKYSVMAKMGKGLWVDEFDAMASKTVVKLLLSKYAPMTVDMQKATLADQAILTDENEYSYPDNKPLTPENVAADKEHKRVIEFIKNAKTVKELSECEEHLTDDETKELFRVKKEALQKGK